MTVTVSVPGAEYRMNNRQTAAYAYMHFVIASLLGDTQGDERIALLSAIISGVSRELRRELGPDGAAQMFHGFGDTQHEAAKLDL
jgi:hypothetical protein